MNNIWKIKQKLIADNLVKKSNTGLLVNSFFDINSDKLTVVKGRHLLNIDTISLITQLPVNSIINDIFKFNKTKRLKSDNLISNLVNPIILNSSYQNLSVGWSRLEFFNDIISMVQDYILSPENIFQQLEYDEPVITLDASIKLSLQGAVFSGTYNNPKKFTATRVNPNKITISLAPIFPPANDLLLNLKFDIINIDGIDYFKDSGPLSLNCLTATTNILNDSIQLNTDIRLQNVCLTAGCFSQFYNGTIPDIANTSKTVLLTDIAQMYFNNYIFGNTDNNIFLIYSVEQLNDNLNIILDRIGSRIEKISLWGNTSTIAGAFLTELFEDQLYVMPTDYRDGVFVYDLTNKTITILQAVVNHASNVNLPFDTITITPNNHLIAFPYNETRLLDINLVTKEIKLLGNFNNEPDTTGQGRFNRATEFSPVILSDNKLLEIPRTPNIPYNHGITKYNYVTNEIEVFGANVFSYFSTSVSNCCGLIKINDNLVVAIPRGMTKVVNIDPVNNTTVSYGNLPSGDKYQSFIKIHDDLITCIPYAGAGMTGLPIANIHPLSKTVDLYGSFNGSYLYYECVKLTNGHILGIPYGATQFLDVDPINMTYELWGNNITGFIDMSFTVLPSGDIIMFPYIFNTYLLRINPITRDVKQVYLFPSTGRTYGMFGTGSPSPQQIKENQILAIPYMYPNIIDFDPITEKIYKLGYFDGLTPEFESTSKVHIYNNRILVCMSQKPGIVDITLR
jgi:hypothetical protein